MADGTLTWQDKLSVRRREIVAWARSQGYKASALGDIPARIVAAYERRQEP